MQRMTNKLFFFSAFVVVSCAHQPAVKPTFEAFRGEPVSITITDKGGLFTASPDIVDAAKQSVERQLIAHAITVADGSERQVHFDIEKTDDCVRVTAKAKRLSLSTSEFGFQRCPGKGTLSDAGQVFATAIYGAMQGSDSLKGEPKAERVEAKTFAEALGEVLAAIDLAAQKN